MGKLSARPVVVRVGGPRWTTGGHRSSRATARQERSADRGATGVVALEIPVGERVPHRGGPSDTLAGAGRGQVGSPLAGARFGVEAVKSLSRRSGGGSVLALAGEAGCGRRVCVRRAVLALDALDPLDPLAPHVHAVAAQFGPAPGESCGGAAANSLTGRISKIRTTAAAVVRRTLGPDR